MDPADPIGPDDPRVALDVERLFPTDDAVMARTRGRLVAAARAASLATNATASRHDRRARPPRWAAAAAALTACVVLGAGLAAADDGPGQPFYPVRLAVEAWSLPPVGTSARWNTELGHLADRLQEARAASARDDEVAASAALEAYATQVDALTAEAAAPGADAAQLDARLDLDRTVLDGLPDAASAAVAAALQHVGTAQQSLASPGNGDHSGNGAGGGGAPGGGGAGGSGNGQGGNGGGGNGGGDGSGNGHGPLNSHQP